MYLTAVNVSSCGCEVAPEKYLLVCPVSTVCELARLVAVHCSLEPRDEMNTPILVLGDWSVS